MAARYRYYTTLSALFRGRGRLVKHTAAADVDGDSCAADSVYATCWCLLGAIVRVYGQGNHRSLYRKLAEAIRELFPDRVLTDAKTQAELVAHFNDCAATSIEDIRAVVKKARLPSVGVYLTKELAAN